MNTHSYTREESNSSGSSNLGEESILAFDTIFVCCLFVLITIALVVFELFVCFFHYGSTRPLWAYILGGVNVVLIFLTALYGMAYLARFDWRLNKNQNKTNTASKVLVLGLFGILFCCFNIFPFQNQSYFSPLLIFIGGFGIGLFTVVVSLASSYLFFGRALFKKFGEASK